MLNAHFWTWSDSTSDSKSECKTDRRSSPNEKLGVKKVGIPLSGQLVVHQTTLSRVYVYRGWVTRLLVFSMYKRFTTHSLNSDASLCKRHQRGVATSSFVTPVHDELSFLSSSIIKKKMETVNLPNNHTQNVCVTWLTILKTLQIPRKHKATLLSTLFRWLCVANEVSLYPGRARSIWRSRLRNRTAAAQRRTVELEHVYVYTCRAGWQLYI